MKMRRTLAVSRKEWLHIVRDIRSLILAFAIPVVLLLLFGYALTLDVDRVPVVVWNQDGSQVSRDLIGRLAGSRYFNVKRYIESYSEVEYSIEKGDAMAAVVIPLKFGGDITAGKTTPVQVILDGSDANTASIVRGYLESVVGSFSNEIMLNWARQRTKQGLVQGVSFRPRIWFNEDLTSRNYVIPGLIAVIMMILAALLTSLTVSKEWENGTMEQLISTPVKSSELVIGKLIPYVMIGMADMLLVVGMGRFLFHVPMRGSYLLLFVVALIFLIGGLMIGMLLSIVTKNQFLSIQLSIVVTYLPALLLSGFVYPISSMPLPIQILTHIVPARYFITIIKSVYLKGLGVQILWWDMLLLTAFCVIILSTSIRKFRKRLE
jgi:ABC-2 type transport system permease protein